MKKLTRCEWAGVGLMRDYHDKEWGVHAHQDQKLFEFIILEGVQAGLSWETILKKRSNYKKALHRFDPNKISRYTVKDINRLLSDKGIIRNRLKIAAIINNAKRFLEIKKEFGSFDKYIWQFVGYNHIKNEFKLLSEIPATTKESDTMSQDLRKRGFKFVGSTICYAFMQTTGMVNDHVVSRFRYRQV